MTTTATSNNKIELLAPARRYLKKLKDKKLKEIFIAKLEEIRENPTEMGDAKVGDLDGIYTCGFRYQKVDYRIAYKIELNDDGTLTIVIMVGPHENFYNNLKDYIY